MVGTQTDSSGKHPVLGEEAAGGAEAAPPPVLGGMSEAELDAALNMLRTDKNLVLAPPPVPGAPLGAVTERLLREAAREEPMPPAWYVAVEERVVGPIDLATLRTQWDKGELGPDSLCWHEGFGDWRPVCRVRALSELLAPRPPKEAAVSATELVPEEHNEVPGFELKGMEALRELAEATSPPVPDTLSDLPPFLDPEPVTAPALPPFLEPEPVTAPAAPSALEVLGAAAPSVEAAGAHPVLPPAQVEVRIRGGLWLALGGGLVGGVLVALFLWGLGPRAAGWGSSLQVTAPGATFASNVPPAVGSAPVPAPVPVGSAPVPVPVSGTAIEASQPMVTVYGPTMGMGPLVSGGFAPGVPFWNPDLAAAASGITGPVGMAPGALLPLLPSPASPALEAPKPVVVTPRPVVAPPPLRKLAKVEVALEPEAPAEVVREAPPPAKVEEEELDEDLGLDEDFERELNGPPNRSKQAASSGRTVWIPPEPARAPSPATLAQSDVFAVVLANKGDIVSCVGARKAQDAEEGNKVVMRWTILTSGKVTDVVTETAEFQGTALARCLEGKIRAWTFPKHREQGGAVRFPFVF